MHFVKSDRLSPGMLTARAIHLNGKLMLAGNKALTAEIIDTLRRNDYYGVYVYDEYSDIESLQELVSEETRHKMLCAFEDFDTDKVMYLSNDLVDGLMENGGEIVVDLNALSIYDQSTFDHSLNVALTSAACGIGLGLNNEECTQLTASALLHDCGKRRIPHSILSKPGQLTDEEYEIIKRHAQYGYDMLYNRADVHPATRAGVLCHHENEDGSGYPKGLSGKDIPLFARIIHVADVYDALLQKRAYKDKLSQSECIEYLMGGCGTLFNLDVVTAFLKYIAVYPVGCEVNLSDGRQARVIENVPGKLTRPVVAILGEPQNIVDLARDRETYNITVLGEITEEESPVSVPTEEEKLAA